MTEVRYTLLSEGTSDQALLRIIDWLLRSHLCDVEIQGTWADLARLPKPPKSLAERITQSLVMYDECDVLFVHRDADGQGVEKRLEEIVRAADELQMSLVPPIIGVVPVRMMEAWLLFDEAAIRRAADNPRGKERLSLPPL
jgi:hypothetical protein